DVEVALGALDADPAGAQGVEVRPSCDEGHVGPGRGEAAAEVAADAARADDRDAHGNRIVARSRAAKSGALRADAEREREHDDDREARRVAQDSNGVAGPY